MRIAYNPKIEIIENIGKKTIVNLPPAGAHVFKVVQPKDEAEWLKVLIDEIVKNHINTEHRHTLEEIFKADHKFVPSNESKNNPDLISTVLETKDKKYLLTVPVHNPECTNLQIKEM